MAAIIAGATKKRVAESLREGHDQPEDVVHKGRDAQQANPFGAYLGDGHISSSDERFFLPSGRREASLEYNAKCDGDL